MPLAHFRIKMTPAQKRTVRREYNKLPAGVRGSVVAVQSMIKSGTKSDGFLAVTIFDKAESCRLNKEVTGKDLTV